MKTSIIEHIFRVEGWPKYTNAQADRGGPTKGGITLATLRAHRGRDVSVDDLRNLSEDEAREIYWRRFVESPGFSRIANEALCLHVVDCGVMSGPLRAAQWLQEAARVVADGRIGPGTLAAVNAPGAALAINLRLAAIRIRFLGRLIEKDRSQAKWAGGWMNRATGFIDQVAAQIGRPQ